MNGINYHRVIENLSELKLYKTLVGKIIKYLENSGPLTLWDIISFVGGSDRRVLRLLDQMVKTKLVKFRNGHFISAPKIKPSVITREVICPNCEGKAFTISGDLKRIAKIMKNIYRHRPKPTFVFNQRPVTLNTTLRRVAYMIYKGDLQGKKIAVIGDDDLTSLVIAFTGMAYKVAIFDIDKRLIDFLKRQDKEFRLKLEVVHCDLTEGIPSNYINKFDVFSTDPTPTPLPFTMFMNAGIKMLRSESGGVGYASAYSSGMEKTLAIQKIFQDMGLLITDMIPHFTEYEFIKATYSKEDTELLRKYEHSHSHQNRLSFFESLIRFETTEETTVIPIKFKLKDLSGSATTRVLANLSRDPAFETDKDKAYIERVAKLIIKNKEKEIEL